MSILKSWPVAPGDWKPFSKNDFPAGCIDCDNCRLFCPETAVSVEDTRRIDMDYCKGCGVCVVECPRGAMTLEEGDHETGS
ncbi:MAG: 4Fe-4S binding protein [Deltaproteobacteria bacterium]|nr:4Fe-4S binding protein [Deltaproteobacteria bacterium]